jgi:hypothetical protein
VYRTFESGEKGAFLVTFKPADMESAHHPEAMLKVAQFEKTAPGMLMTQFLSSGKYHEVRGTFVHQTVQEHHKRTRKWIQDFMPGVSIASSIPISNSFMLVARKEDIKRLEDNEFVAEIHTNESFKVKLPQRKEQSTKELDDTFTGRLFNMMKRRKQSSVQWNVAKIGADQVWELDDARSRGQGILYAIADTGVQYEHPNIKGNYLGLKADGTYNHDRAWYDGVRRPVAVEGEIKCGFASQVPCDDQGHGTHVTSTAVGAAGYGVAPGAKWMACRNMDRGVGSPETYLNCLNFFLAPHGLDGKGADPRHRPHVVGNSYGCPDSEGCSKHAMTAAVEALRAAGIFMSVSAGNEGPDCSTIADPPALEKSVVSVGATDNHDQLASFSSRGPCIVGKETYRKPDVSAPGVRVLAAYPNNSYRALSGTSMASPHVGGAAALISALCPCIARDVDKIQSLLESTAVKLRPPRSDGPLCGGDKPDSVPNNYFGYGRINVLQAVRTCQNMCKAEMAAKK